MKKISLFLILIVTMVATHASLEVQKVADNVYALVGETTQR